MPFQRKSLNLIPRGDKPDVQIIFHGQLILRSTDGQGCDVAVNPIATAHRLSIETRIKKQGKVDRIAMRHLGPLNFRNPEGMLIEVRSLPGAAPVVSAAYKLVTDDPIDYGNPNSTAADDFRWILNLEGDLFHDAVLNAPVFNSQNVIRMRGGEYNFKTASRPNARWIYHRRGGSQPDRRMDSIGAIACADVYLERDQRLVMKWQDDTQEEDRALSLPKKTDGTHYEIYIENTPLYLDPPVGAAIPDREELKEYYKLFPGIPPELGKRFALVPELLNPLIEAGSPEIPCQVVTLDGPGPG